MEFKKNDEIIIIDEKKNKMFEAKEVDPAYPCVEKDSKCSKRWLESLGDCA